MKTGPVQFCATSPTSLSNDERQPTNSLQGSKIAPSSIASQLTVATPHRRRIPRSRKLHSFTHACLKTYTLACHGGLTTSLQPPTFNSRPRIPALSRLPRGIPPPLLCLPSSSSSFFLLRGLHTCTCTVLIPSSPSSHSFSPQPR